jgi:hypothetical protein
VWRRRFPRFDNKSGLKAVLMQRVMKLVDVLAQSVAPSHSAVFPLSDEDVTEAIVLVISYSSMVSQRVLRESKHAIGGVIAPILAAPGEVSFYEHYVGPTAHPYTFTWTSTGFAPGSRTISVQIAKGYLARAPS